MIATYAPMLGLSSSEAILELGLLVAHSRLPSTSLLTQSGPWLPQTR